MANVSQTLSAPVWAQVATGADPAIEYGATDFRGFIDALFAAPGVVRAGHLSLSQRAAGANWSIDVAAGHAVVAGPAGQKYYVRVPATVNVPLTGLNTAPASTRTHVAYLAVYDKSISGTSYGAAVFVGEDTGSGAPTPTGSPVGYITLGRFTIAPAQASVTDTHIINEPDAALAGNAVRPVMTHMVSDPPLNVLSTYVDFTSTAWPRPTFVVPPSRLVAVTLEGSIRNDNTSDASVIITYRFSPLTPTTLGGNAYADIQGAINTATSVNVMSSKRMVWQFPADSPGVTITVVPRWYISSGGPSTVTTNAMALLIEPVP